VPQNNKIHPKLPPRQKANVATKAGRRRQYQRGPREGEEGQDEGGTGKWPELKEEHQKLEVAQEKHEEFFTVYHRIELGY